MDNDELQHRLNSITTQWSAVLRAHQPAGDSDGEERRLLLERYAGAVYRYLFACVRDPDSADELFQEFALRFVRGDFRNADPQRGRFRDFLKTALLNLVRKHCRQQRHRPLPLADESQVAAAPQADVADEEFVGHWRQELLTRAWRALEALEQQSGKPYHTVLRLRAESPQLSSGELAEQLAARLGRPVTAAAQRQALHRAREKFAELLIAEVGQSLQTDERERIEQELLDLGLFPYCRGAWAQRQDPG
jgi:RNA polymerase sigma-70 factor (ECF subfamily)